MLLALPQQKSRAKPSLRALALHTAVHGKVTTSGRPFRACVPRARAPVSSRGRALTVGCCVRALECCSTLMRRGFCLLCSRGCVRGGARLHMLEQIPGPALRIRGVRTNTCSVLAAAVKKSINQNGFSQVSFFRPSASQWQKVARQSPTTARKLSQPIWIIYPSLWKGREARVTLLVPCRAICARCIASSGGTRA